VNAWLEPRFTADIDVTVNVTPEGAGALRALLLSRGFTIDRELGSDLPSGPDFVRWLSTEGEILEIQSAKTAFQAEVVRRAETAGGARVATPEDLLVLKLIADRMKDRVDIVGLVGLPDLDWAYVEHWAREWDVLESLERYRAARHR
jgi:hypothetical protein